MRTQIKHVSIQYAAMLAAILLLSGAPARAARAGDSLQTIECAAPGGSPQFVIAETQEIQSGEPFFSPAIYHVDVVEDAQGGLTLDSGLSMSVMTLYLRLGGESGFHVELPGSRSLQLTDRSYFPENVPNDFYGTYAQPGQTDLSLSCKIHVAPASLLEGHSHGLDDICDHPGCPLRLCGGYHCGP